jgi:hypothetical protein
MVMMSGLNPASRVSSSESESGEKPWRSARWLVARTTTWVRGPTTVRLAATGSKTGVCAMDEPALAAPSSKGNSILTRFLSFILIFLALSLLGCGTTG